MATIDKKYLDLAGLKAYDEKIKGEIDKKVAKDSTAEAHDLGLYKVKTNANGLVTGVAEVTKSDLSGLVDAPGNGTLTIKAGAKTTTFTANQSTNSSIEITAADLGLTSALRYIGVSTTDPASGTATVASHITWEKGDVVSYGTKEFVLTGSNGTAGAWKELGDEGSHALKTITITGDDGLTGGGDLSASRKITHAVPAGAEVHNDFGAYKIKTDKFGHVVGTSELTASSKSSGTHTHELKNASCTVNVSVATPTEKHLNLNTTKTQDFVTGVTASTSKLVKTSIIPAVANGTVTPAVAIAEADRPTKTTFTAVTASKATAGTAITYGSANVASEATTVGNANVAAAATTVGNANVGTAAKVNVTATESGKAAYNAAYDDTTETLSLTPITLQTAAIAQAVASSTSIYGAVESTKSIYGAVASTSKLTPYTFSDVTASNITENVAVDAAKAGTAINVATVGKAVDVATGTLSSTGTGDEIVIGTSADTAKAVTDVALDTTKTTGVAFVETIENTTSQQTATVTGTISEAGAHTHDIELA